MNSLTSAPYLLAKNDLIIAQIFTNNVIGEGAFIENSVGVVT